MTAAKGKATGLKQIILDADDLAHEDLEVPEWGVTVRIRGLSGTDRDRYEAQQVAVRRAGNSAELELRLADYRSKLVVRCLVDPATDERIFADGDAPALGRKSGLVIDRLFEIARRLSGMDDNAEAAARGNSGTAQSGGSTTD